MLSGARSRWIRFLSWIRHETADEVRGVVRERAQAHRRPAAADVEPELLALQELHRDVVIAGLRDALVDELHDVRVPRRGAGGSRLRAGTA